MDDDLRNRFRNPRRSYDVGGFGRPRPVSRPVRASPSPQPPTKPQPASRPQPQPSSKSDMTWSEVVKSTPKTTKPQRDRKKRGMVKKLFVTLIVLGLLAAIAAAAYTYIARVRKSDIPEETESSQQTSTAPITGSIRMIATGDNLAFESINNAAKTPTGYDYLPMMENFKPLFAKADIRLCNETTIGGGEALGISGFPSFNAPTAWSTSFAALGCNVMNLASDHTNDKGQAGIDAMIASWKSQPDILAYAGANSSAEEQAQIKYFNVKNLKFAYLSYTTKTVKTDTTPFGVNLYNAEAAKAKITEARKNANLIIVSITWGNEDQSAITGEQDKIAQELADAGVDVIVGSGPHVLQPAKILDGQDGHQTLVWFSLGNFLNSQLPLSNLIGGMAVMDFDLATGQINDPKLLPVYMHYEWTATQKAAGTVNARANFKLFPLDQAADALARSQNNTTVAEQTARVTGIITQFAPIKVITTAEL